ncbi:MAG TPA: histidine kinase dimerization/phospho-acceptor domain-containing protein, partial [Planctomycetota bacterium]|nr:histidine kinase dimerization/phospho-acceptor domain-containing protein [Planctomycetota bacterium]
MLMVPANEIDRLKALRDLAVLDTAAEASFDELTKAAALMCETPIALIGFIDEERQWYKSKIGIAAESTSRELTFCTQVILTQEPLTEVPDATKDRRFQANPAVVTDPGIRFYAGVPLVDGGGHALGTLCVVDTKPRTLQPWQREALTLLARQVMRLLDARSAANRLVVPAGPVGGVEPLKSLIEEVPTGAVLVGTDGRLEVNAEAYAMLGFPVQQVFDIDSWFTHLYGDAHGPARQLYEQDRRDSFPDPRVIWVRCGNGSRRQIEFNGVRSSRGEMWLLRDVTATIGAEERFRVLFEQSSDAHLIFDEHGIIDCNHATVAMLRCGDKRQVLSLHPARLSPDFQPDGRRSDEKCIEMDRLARERGHHRFEWMHRRRDGTDFPVEVSLTPVTLSGNAAMLVVWHDISERKALEQQLRDSISRAEGAAHAKADFLATMSHELRTPMNGVIGMTSLLLDTALNEQQREFAETVRTCGDQLLALINDILDFSKIESGHLVLEKISFSPRRLAEDAIGLLADQAQKKGLQVVCLI